MTWNGTQAIEQINAEVGARLSRCAAIVRDRAEANAPSVIKPMIVAEVGPGEARIGIAESTDDKMMFLAHVMELGGKTAPHPIVARRAPFLHFFWKRKSRWVMALSVNHPGSKFSPIAYLRRALDHSRTEVEHELHG